MPYTPNVNPEWGYLASPSIMRTARLIALATVIGAIVGAATVFSLLDRPVAKESVAARTLVAPDSDRPLTNNKSAMAQQPTDSQQAPAAVQNDQNTPPAPARGSRALPTELAATSMPQRPTSVGTAPPSAQTFNDIIAVEPAPEPTPKPQSKKPRLTSRTAAPRYGASGYDGYFDRPRYGHEPSGPRYGSRGSFAWAPYY